MTKSTFFISNPLEAKSVATNILTSLSLKA